MKRYGYKAVPARPAQTVKPRGPVKAKGGARPAKTAKTVTPNRWR